MKKKTKIGLISFVLAGSVLFTSGCHLFKDEKEGEILEKPSVVDTIPEENITEVVEIPVSNETEDIQTVTVEVTPTVYDILENKGYHLNDFPDIDHDSLATHDYVAFDHDLGVTTTDVNFRTGPSTEYKIIETLDPTASVDLVAKCDNGWFLVQRNGSLGFIRGDYIRQINDDYIMEQMRNLPDIVPIVTATTNVKIRPESNTDKTEYGLLKTGKSLQMIRKLENGWYEVLYEGKVAYVCGDYVKEAFAIEGDYSKFVTVTSDTHIYDVPYGMEMGTIPQYETAKVYGEIDDYYYVESNGQIGYVPKSRCVSLNGTYVIVDISDQTVTLYNGTEEILTSNVVTGKDSTPSDLGLFDVDGKQLDATLSGPGYSVGVKYWMPYNGGEGLHDASWRGSFGGEIYHNSGSHGCVNMPYDQIEALYYMAEVGTPVYIVE